MKEKKENVNGEEHGIDSRIEKLRALRKALADLAESGITDGEEPDVSLEEVDAYRVLYDHEAFCIAADRVEHWGDRILLCYGDRTVASFPNNAVVILGSHIVDGLE